ncbi:MAG: NAD(P)/FAD-dependent oxidoreductase, partial [Rhodopirellula sp. JB055]|uniref:NAD(P)/FAD-dependent oxidoreductase n=1 Tax=Rhodopirellula sp. JB055 TaxID=3342846 RepID=UPI00370AF03A
MIARDDKGGLGKVSFIGAGVSGCAAAARFVQRGAQVTLFEKSRFPREKVCGCCLGAAGLSALDAIGVGQSVRELGVPTKFFRGIFQSSASDSSAVADRGAVRQPVPGVCIPFRPGVAISRAKLDSHLLQFAVQSGVEVRQPCEATIVAQSDEQVWIDGGMDSPEAFDLVVVAAGLTGRFRQKSAPDLGWIETPQGPLGVSTQMSKSEAEEIGWQLDEGEIQMHCGRDGYIGIVRLPDGGLDLAAAIHPRRKLNSATGGGRRAIQTQMLSLLLGSGRFSWSQARQLERWFLGDAQWQTTPPLRRKRVSGKGRVVAIGDAAGYVEPLTGEGMTWGIESGLAVADFWALYRLTQLTPNGVGDFGAHWDSQAVTFQNRRRQL